MDLITLLNYHFKTDTLRNFAWFFICSAAAGMEGAANRNPLDISLLETIWPRAWLPQCQQGSPAAGYEGTRDPYFSLQDLTPLYFYILTS